MSLLRSLNHRHKTNKQKLLIQEDHQTEILPHKKRVDKIIQLAKIFPLEIKVTIKIAKPQHFCQKTFHNMSLKIYKIRICKESSLTMFFKAANPDQSVKLKVFLNKLVFSKK